MARLTDKQKRFVEEYLVDLNATKAAKRAGYSEKTADRIGPELLGKTCVSEAIQEAMDERSSRTEITQDAVLRELAAIGFSKATDFVKIRQNGRVALTPTDELSAEQQKVIASIKDGKYGVEIKLHDKLGALHLLGQHLGMFDSRAGQTQSGENNIFEVIEASTGKEIDTSEIPELEHTAESGDDLVE